MLQRIHLGLLLGVLIFCSGCQVKESSEEQSPPNILFIAVDDLRPELGCYGANHIHSPNIDKLAKQSLIFDRAYCNVPVCGASRASILSGIRPGWHRFRGYDTYLDKDYPGVISLPHHFRNNGYQTVSLGKIYHYSDDDTLAWNTVWDPPILNKSGWRDYLTEENLALFQSFDVRGLPYEKADVPDTAYFDGKIAERAIQELKAFKTSGEPFFLAAGFLKPHLPFNAPTKYWELYDTTNIQLPENYQRPESTPKNAFHNFGELRHYASVPKEGQLTEAMAKKLIHGYYACVSYTDAQIGKILQTLEELELAQNTIVILWGDHGWNLGDHQLWCKHCNFESSLHVPLLLKVPGETSGQRTDAIVEYIDIYPSLAELSGLSIPEHTEGESLVPLLSGKRRNKNYAIAKYWRGITLIEDQYFYTEWLNDSLETKARMLFDHKLDPLELENLAEMPEQQERVEFMSQQLRKNWGSKFLENNRDSK